MAEGQARRLSLGKRVQRLSAAYFVDRELFLRANDRVQYLRISARAQKWMASAAVLALGWLTYSTLAYFLSGYVERSKDAEIAQHRLAYFDLLSEVTEYQTQFAQITRNLQENQDYLLSLLDGEQDVATASIVGNLKTSETAFARVAVARGALRERLQGFESELMQIADRSDDLQAKVSGLKEALLSTEAERQAVTAARERLDRRLEQTQQELALASATKVELEQSVRALLSELAATEQSHAEQVAELEAQKQQILQHGETERARLIAAAEAERAALVAAADAERATLIAEAEAERAALIDRSESQIAALQATRDQLSQRLEQLETQLASTTQKQEGLQLQVSSLEGALSRALASGEEAQADRQHLQLQVASLESLIADMRDQQQELVDRVEVRTEDGIEGLEAVVVATGLDVDKLLAEVEGYSGGQGGPFIPADDLLATDVSYELQVSVAMLDRQLDRWEALHKLVAALPMAAPLEHYEINSEFGYRKDPINGRSALHTGLDFGAPRNTPLYTTAPGVVTFAGWRGRYGRVVEIDHGYGVKTRFAHLAKISVKKGQSVALGEEVGLLGASGRVTGPHLHYEILFEGKPYDPMNFIKAGKDVL